MIRLIKCKSYFSVFFHFKKFFQSYIERTMAVHKRPPILPQTKTYLTFFIKQQTRTFHRLVKGSGLNALVGVKL